MFNIGAVPVKRLEHQTRTVSAHLFRWTDNFSSWIGAAERGAIQEEDEELNKVYIIQDKNNNNNNNTVSKSEKRCTLYRDIHIRI